MSAPTRALVRAAKAAATALALGAAGCSLPVAAPAATTVAGGGLTTAGPTSVLQPPAAREVGVCVDRSDSVPDDLAYNTLDQVASVIALRYPPAPVVEGAGAAVAPNDGLRVRVRTIGRDSFEPDAQIADIVIPGATGIEAPPDIVADTTGFAQWRAVALAEVVPSHQAAHDAAQGGVAVLNGMRGQLPVERVTELDGCVSAFAQTVGPLADRRLVVASDFEAYGTVDVAGDAAGLRILAVLHCADRSEVCDERMAAFSATWQNRGAAVTVVRPESAGEAIFTFLTEPVAP